MSSETREIMHDQEDHPIHGTRTYWIIGIILIVITALEILAYVVEDSLAAAATPVILVLSAAKFALVVMFYMHLKYDSKVFSGIFLFPLALGTLVVVGITILYKVLHPLEF
jgi:cytochrome c oxidase subunit 4